ncbi:MAG: benzoate-CoA ligase family protein [Acidobacteriota bacterium]
MGTKAVTLPETLNLADHFLARRLRAGDGDRVALRLAGRSLTYGEVKGSADDVSRALLARGVRREERVLLVLPDGAEFVAAFFGILQIGAVAVMLNPGLRPEEVESRVAYVRPRLAVVEPGAADAYRRAASASPWLEGGLLTIPSSGGDGAADADSLATALASAGDGPVAMAPTHRDDPAVWLFSGGTTGHPKAVVQSHRSFANTTELYAVRTLGYGPDDVTLSVPKLFFGYATGSNLLFPFAVGGSSVLFPDPPTVETLFEQIARHRPTIFIAVPTVIGRMVAHPDAADQDLSCLRFATSAGEALPPSLYDAWLRTFGVELLDGLGTAEMWHVFLTNRPGEARPGTLGRAVDGFEIKVCDPDGNPMPDGSVGRLWVRGESRADGYWQAAKKSTDAFRGEWFASSDLVCRDDEGYVTFCGRSDDAIKVSGRWLVPAEVEGCLLGHSAVAECAVVGARSPEGLLKPYAFVLPHDAAEDGLEDELKAYALGRLQAYKHPRRVLILDAFPRTHLGKVDRGKLRASVESPDAG